MTQNRKINFAILLLLILTVGVFAYSYNTYITSVVMDVAKNDKEILQLYNTEIIERLTREESIDGWSEIVESYSDLVIVIEDSNNEVVTRTADRAWSNLDVRVRTPFDYKGKAYLIRTSVYLLRDYVSDSKVLLRFLLIELLICLSVLILLIFIIYTLMLRPYRSIYKAIEEYDKTGKLTKVKLKGYAGRVYGRFASMAKNLEIQHQRQNQIIASISHDIKTPLTSIMGYSERLKKDSLPPERRENYLNTVYDKAVEIETLVDEFDEYLSYNLPYEVNLKSVSVDEIVSCINRDYSDDLSHSDIEFAVVNFCEEGASVKADSQRLKRVCGNILANSVKHINNSEKFIRIDILPEKESVLFVFNDSGEGVEEDKLEIIFEPLYTSDKGRKVAGLGLAICYEIVNSHGGEIYAKKSDMGGLAVCVRLMRG